MTEARQPSARPRILVVEDDPGTGVLLRHILVREGFDVVLAVDGREAVAVVEKEPPPLVVLTDMMLPYLDGLEIIRRIRGNPKWCDVPILVLTAKSQEKDVVRALDAGATDYVHKPFRPEELLARVRRCLRSAR